MRTRFAPAPTGWLHLGHVSNAEFVWSAGADVLLRIEDHDRERCRPEYEAGILDDLDWLGYRPDIFHTDAFRAGVCDGRQSDREGVYREAVDILARQGLLYGCDCTRREIEQRTPGRDEAAWPSKDGAVAGIGDGSAEPAQAAGELRYDGYCRERTLPVADGLGWRVRMTPGAERFCDERLGPQEQDPSRQCGDVLVRDRLANWTYQFAAAVDDFRQGIDLVIRGEDLLASTGRQIRLARLLGRDRAATFLHHPLIMKTADRKLSKSDRDTGIRELRAAGRTPEEVREAARRRIPAPLPRSRREPDV